MEHVNVRVRSITLLDPKMDDYRSIRGCTYESGVFSFGDVSVPSTTLSNLTVEEWGHLHGLYSPSLYDPFSVSGTDVSSASIGSHHNEQHHKKHLAHTASNAVSSGTISSTVRISSSSSTSSLTEQRHQFDTVIVMNVLVYAKNAFQYLETVYNSVRPGGLLIFHDRWFDDPAVSSRCKMAGFLVNILQVRKPLLDHFLSEQFFDHSRSPFFSTNQTSNQLRRSREWCRIDWDNERGFWVALRKKAYS
jgi:hypothetical protein